ncbi:MAG: hypothetical protein JWP16_651 [Alphaproteobacteria bacterium]|nr:hypothetical protein [Alphaproteobacteria bacterium]
MRKMIFVGFAGALALAPSVAFADAREDVVGGLARCAHLTEDRQWLDCYYGAAQPMRAALGLSPAPLAQIALVSAQPKAAAMPSTISRATVRTGPPPPPRSSGLLDVWGGSDIVNNSPIASYDVSKNGFTVTLPDGQVWAQTDVDKHSVSWRQPSNTMRVTISQAAMHTFNLVLNDENQHYKVKRVR